MQLSHTAHRLHPLSRIEAVSGVTPYKTPINLLRDRCAHAEVILAQRPGPLVRCRRFSVDVHRARGILFSPRRRGPLPPTIGGATRHLLWRKCGVAKAVNLADCLEGRTTALTVSDVAELLNISERQVYKLAAEKSIPCFKVGASVRFDPSSFAAWLRQRMAPASVRSSRADRQAQRAS